jgi:flagellar hook-basal body complex protein FliE
MMSPMIAAKVYAAVQNQAAGAASATPKAGADDGPGFGELVKSAVNDAISSSKHAETQMIAQAQGKAELVDVVTAISSAQSSLQTVMAVRDQVISAYQQVMAMPI